MRAQIPAFIALLSISMSPANAENANRWFLVSGGDWVPTSSQLVELRSKIEAETTVLAKARRRDLLPWGSYQFQYQGEVEKGRQVIHVQGVCHDPSSGDLSKQWISISDGGACVFNIIYDVSAKKFFALDVNGEA